MLAKLRIRLLRPEIWVWLRSSERLLAEPGIDWLRERIWLWLVECRIRRLPKPSVRWLAELLRLAEELLRRVVVGVAWLRDREVLLAERLRLGEHWVGLLGKKIAHLSVNRRLSEGTMVLTETCIQGLIFSVVEDFGPENALR